jgi:hypothetical protein
MERGEATARPHLPYSEWECSVHPWRLYMALEDDVMGGAEEIAEDLQAKLGQFATIAADLRDHDDRTT